MTDLQSLGDEAVLRTLGERLAQRRLERNLTQAQLAKQAGIARGALQRLELGEPVTTLTLIRILRVLDALSELDHAFPELGPSPLQALELRRGRRRRASGRQAPPAPGDKQFRWGRD